MKKDNKNNKFIEKYKKDTSIKIKNGKVEEISGYVNMKISTKDYENVDVNAGIKISLNNDANLFESYDEMWEILFEQIANKVEEIKNIYEI